MKKQRRSYLIISIACFIISMWLVSLMGCALVEPDVAYKKSCWEIAIGAAVGARFELGLDKADIRIATGDWPEKSSGIDLGAFQIGYPSKFQLGHAWAEIKRNGKWVRVTDKGKWYTTSTWQNRWVAEKYFKFNEALDLSKAFGPRK